ncbi:MAG: hypothetical protein IPJ30_25615 [Acidobacteria bacterium]|nr:hypothetical protein [Acidobacteriota bacterium]
MARHGVAIAGHRDRVEVNLRPRSGDARDECPRRDVHDVRKPPKFEIILLTMYRAPAGSPAMAMPEAENLVVLVLAMPLILLR